LQDPRELAPDFVILGILAKPFLKGSDRRIRATESLEQSWMSESDVAVLRLLQECFGVCVKRQASPTFAGERVRQGEVTPCVRRDNPNVLLQQRH
jgi:hypothetical protein